MNWITEHLAVGEITDCGRERRQALQDSGIGLIMDIRHLFTQPLKDELEDAMPRPEIWRFIGLLAQVAGLGWKIMIHCHGGIDRSPFVAMLYVYLTRGIPYEEAYDYVSKMRPQTIQHPDWVAWARNSKTW